MKMKKYIKAATGSTEDMIDAFEARISQLENFEDVKLSTDIESSTDNAISWDYASNEDMYYAFVGPYTYKVILSDDGGWWAEIVENISGNSRYSEQFEDPESAKLACETWGSQNQGIESSADINESEHCIESSIEDEFETQYTWDEFLSNYTNFFGFEDESELNTFVTSLIEDAGYTRGDVKWFVDDFEDNPKIIFNDGTVWMIDGGFGDDYLSNVTELYR